MEGVAMPHKIMKAVSVGSVGDLGRIARALADAQPPYDIAAVGGGEGVAMGHEVGIVTFMIKNDDADNGEIVALMKGVDLDDNRHLESVEEHPALAVELTDSAGSLAAAAEALGGENINIMGVMVIDKTSTAAHVGFGFENDTERDRAKTALQGAGFTVIDDHHDH
jgi:hypothetical protein